MTPQIFAVGIICLMLASSSVTSLDYNFMNCEGNDSIFNVLRRCCKDNQLPNGCECFDISDKSDFTNSAFHRPKCPSDIKATFTLYTRSTATNGEIIRSTEAGIAGTAFSGSRKTHFIAHGFTDEGQSPWWAEMKDMLLNEGDHNVIVVDWKEGAKGPNYFQATVNARMVGSMIARLITDMNKYAGASYDDFHLIGHSLGAQVVGYAGKEISRLTGQLLGRITGLDPAGPQFESYSPNVRIDKSDAQFVDILHTDSEPLTSLGLGTRYSIGHADFYPNGGKDQPGCPKKLIGIFSLLNFGEQKDAICSHARAFEFFIYSIPGCRWTTAEGGDACAMGYHASPNCRGDYYPTTTGTEPFC